MNRPDRWAFASLPRCHGLLLSLLSAALLPGCAAITNPLADSLPVRYIPAELLVNWSKDKEESIPLALLQQPMPDSYRLDAGDILGVWIDGVVGERLLPIPVHLLSSPAARAQRALAAGAGYPFALREDGTLHLPLIEPLPVRGLNVPEAFEAVRQAYAKKEILPPGKERMFVTLLQKRQYEVVVLRQETTGFGVGAEGATSASGKRGTGAVVNLAAYENDLLHAISLTGGLPGLDAYNEIVIYRRLAPHGPDREELLRKMGQFPPNTPVPSEWTERAPMVRIPLRQEPGLPLTFAPQDVILQTGDVVYLEARDKDVYYTAGLLPTGEHVMPRDKDLDVLTAVSLVRGPLNNGSFGGSTLSGNIFVPGIGQPSASLLVILRKTTDGGQVPIRVDLNRAQRDVRERILVHAGDLLVLQERPTEALARYTSQSLANFNLIWQPIHTRYLSGIADLMGPDRLTGRGQYSIFQPFIQGIQPTSPGGS